MVTDRKIDPRSQTARKEYLIALVTATSQTDAIAFEFTPGFAGEIVQVKSWNRSKAGTVTVNIRTGGAAWANGRAAITALAPTSAAEDTAVLSTTVANLRFTAAEKVRVAFTTDGTGALTNGHILLVVRPRPLNGEYL
jgi:hypothetical protein